MSRKRGWEAQIEKNIFHVLGMDDDFDWPRVLIPLERDQVSLRDLLVLFMEGYISEDPNIRRFIDDALFEGAGYPQEQRGAQRRELHLSESLRRLYDLQYLDKNGSDLLELTEAEKTLPKGAI